MIRRTVICSWVLLLLQLASGMTWASEESMPDQLHVDYIEASTGNRWNLEQLPQRMSLEGVEVHFHARYDFDKSEVLDAVLSETVEGRRLVILQECSVYFPGDSGVRRRLVRDWLERIENSGCDVAVATTVPPAAARGLGALKSFVKHRVLGRPRADAQVFAFNDFLRELAGERQIPLLDLEAMLRVSAEDRHMAEQYDSGDGVHVNAAAYATMDEELARLLTAIVSR